MSVSSKAIFSALTLMLAVTIACFVAFIMDSISIRSMANDARLNGLETGECFDADKMIVGGKVCVERSEKVAETFVGYRVYNSWYELTLIGTD